MALILGISTLPFLYNVYESRKAPLVGVDDPWGWGRSLEWATTSPPPRHNFLQLPRIRSESPAFDVHHPDVAKAEYAASGAPRDSLLDAGSDLGRYGHLDEVERDKGTTSSDDN